MKIFHFPEKLMSLPEEESNILSPLHIRIKPTNICNHNCNYCAYRKDNLQLGKDMKKNSSIPREKMFEIIEDIGEIGVKAITFSGGGEPLCYPYLKDALKLLSNTIIKFAMLTNGEKLEKEISEIFAHRGSWIRVSMDGWDDESYSKYRGVKHGTYTKIIKNIENFKKLNGTCKVGVSLIIDKYNASHLYDMIKRLKDTGIESVKVSPCIVSNSGIENNDYHKPVFDTVREDINRAINNLTDKEFEIFDAYHKLDEQFKKNYTWCPFLQILTVIGADLNIYSCQDKAYNFNKGLLGSISNKRFKDFWFSDKKKFFTINPCTNCNHHCVANEKNKLIIEYLNINKEHLGFV